MKIGDRDIGPEHPPYIIAELGVNHGGDVGVALGLTAAAARADADAIKLQLFEADQLMSRAARLAAYQSAQGEEDPIDMLKRLELKPQDIDKVVAEARRSGLQVIATVFSLEMVDAAQAMRFDAFKVASPDVVNRPLIESLMATGLPLILSTGAATLEEVAEATTWLGTHPHTLMQCVSAYPTPDDDAALGGLKSMIEVNPHAGGYSDHTMAIDTGALAVAAGAWILEKHLTHDRQATGPDHAASLDPAGFAEYVRLARRAARMLGSGEKTPLAVELDVREASRQSVVAVRELPAGYAIQRKDLTIKRPGTGLPPAQLTEIVGRTLTQAAEADMPLTWNHLN